MIESEVTLTGLKETLNGLKQFDQTALRSFRKVVNDELREARNHAIMLVNQASDHGEGSPLSGWRTHPAKRPRSSRGWPAWDRGEVIKSITISRAQGKVKGNYTTNAGALKNASAPGVILELAGRKSSGKTASGKIFVERLKTLYHPASRLVWRAVDSRRASTQRKVADALEVAKSQLSSALNTQSGE